MYASKVQPSRVEDLLLGFTPVWDSVKLDLAVFLDKSKILENNIIAQEDQKQNEDSNQSHQNGLAHVQSSDSVPPPSKQWPNKEKGQGRGIADYGRSAILLQLSPGQLCA